MKYLILNEKIVDKVKAEFPTSKEMFWIDCEADFEIGDLCVGGILGKPAIPDLTSLELRLIEYGSVKDQLEFIVENGIDTFIAKQLAIKIKYPKQ